MGLSSTTSPADSVASHGLVRSAGRPPVVVAFEAGLVDFFVDAADLLGVPKSLAALYGILFASPAPLSFAEIEARLDFSKGSISQGLRHLREIGAVKEVSSPEDKVERFAPDIEMRQLIEHYLESRVETQLRTAAGRFAALEHSLADFAGQDREVLSGRVDKLRRWHDRTQALLPVVRTFLALSNLAKRGKRSA
jgi:DNA-binding transcriptional regulator GbsR (MarR family)